MPLHLLYVQIEPNRDRESPSSLPEDDTSIAYPKNSLVASTPAFVYPSGHPSRSATPICGIHTPAGGRA
jgi:hypothetical protein